MLLRTKLRIRATAFICSQPVNLSFLSFWRNSPPVGQGPLIHEVSRSHSTTHHSR